MSSNGFSLGQYVLVLSVLVTLSSWAKSTSPYSQLSSFNIHPYVYDEIYHKICYKDNTVTKKKWPDTL